MFECDSIRYIYIFESRQHSCGGKPCAYTLKKDCIKNLVFCTRFFNVLVEMSACLWEKKKYDGGIVVRTKVSSVVSRHKDIRNMCTDLKNVREREKKYIRTTTILFMTLLLFAPNPYISLSWTPCLSGRTISAVLYMCMGNMLADPCHALLRGGDGGCGRGGGGDVATNCFL